MKKKCCTVLSLLIIINISVFSGSLSFTSVFSNEINAKDNDLGFVKTSNKSDLMIKIENSLKEELSPSWIENLVSEDNLYYFSKTYSLKLSEILPLNTPYYFMIPIVDKNQTQISIRCEDKKVITFIFDSEKTLIAINVD